MNRIYQGRVTKVQIPKEGVTKPKLPEDWQDLDPDDPRESRRLGEEALWKHHELFQDAVNYYTLALVALGEWLPAEHPITKLRERMRVAWDEFPRKTPSGSRAGEVCANDRPRWKQSITKNPEIACVFDQLYTKPYKNADIEGVFYGEYQKLCAIIYDAVYR
ncbi:MAG: hypothetical protein WC003_08860 [Terrimicrobiaceae bacterium]